MPQNLENTSSVILKLNTAAQMNTKHLKLVCVPECKTTLI